MPVFEYRALSPDGNEMEGVVEADSAREARAELRKQDLHVQELSAALEEDATEEEHLDLFTNLFGRISDSELAHFTRQLSTLLEAGVPLTDCLTALVEQTESQTLENVLRDVREKVTQGETLATALSMHPRYFDNLFISMVKAGEQSGEMADVLDRLSSYLREQSRIQQQIMGALTYPAFIVLFGAIILVYLVGWVLPDILTLLENQNEQLPMATELLIGVTGILESYWWALLAAVVGLFVGYRIFVSTENGKYYMDLFWLKIPVLGSFFRKAAISRFATTFATLQESGLSVMESLSVVQDVVDNRVLAETIRDAREDIMGGSRMARPFRESELFPTTLSYMINVGEESGQLPKLLRTISSAYDDELEVATEQMTSLIEPILIICIAGGVFFVALAILMPLMNMGGMR